MIFEEEDLMQDLHHEEEEEEMVEEVELNYQNQLLYVMILEKLSTLLFFCKNSERGELSERELPSHDIRKGWTRK